MSTLEAQFIACLDASIEAKWLLQLQKDIHDKTYHHCQSTVTIRELSLLSLWESSMLELNTSTFAITTVEICINDE